MTRTLFAAAALAAIASCSPKAPSADDPVSSAERFLRTGDPKSARDALLPYVKDHPTNATALHMLAAAGEQLEDFETLTAANEGLAKLEPNSLGAIERLGDAYLKRGRFADAVREYDREIELQPDYLKDHWKRGIALYYVGRYEDGVKVFEAHKTVNPDDVENSAWHYLCNAKVVGRDKARAALIPVGSDARVPMMEVLKLYGGKAAPEAVLAEAETQPAGGVAGTAARFYGNLYLGLWYESEGNPAKAKEHLTATVEKYKNPHFMWSVANAHLGALKKAEAEKK